MRWRLGAARERVDAVFTFPSGRRHLRLIDGGGEHAFEDEGESGVHEIVHRRPVTRADCREGQRPCPWVSCRHHLYLDVLPTGVIKLNHPGRELGEMRETCSLDVAERDGGITLEETGKLMNVTRERVRQIEARVLRRVRAETVLGGDGTSITRDMLDGDSWSDQAGRNEEE